MTRTSKETMFEDFHYGSVDVIAAERRARELRAKATREALSAAARWIVARLSALRSASAQRA